MNLLADLPQAFGLLHIAGLILSGLLISIVVMAIGVGGGILWTPLLILLYGLTPAEAVATSLAIQVIGMGSGTFAFLRSGLAAPKISLAFFAAALPAVIIGSIFSVNLKEGHVQLALGIMTMALAVLFVSSRDRAIDEDSAPNLTSTETRKLLPVPAGLGFLMGMLSVGLSEWLIPLLRYRLKISMRQAISIVVPTVFLLALAATATHGLLSNHILWWHVLCGGAGTLIGAQLGVLLARRIQDRILKQSFIYLMTLVGIHLIFQSI